jgi:hypothetical protein
LAEYSDESNILEALPASLVTSSVTLLPHWIQGGANATLFLESMSKPRHGKLQLTTDNNWIFRPGTSMDITQGIPLPDLMAKCQHLLDTGQLFRGHSKFRRIYNARAQVQLRQSVLRHVSAYGLTSLVAPTSLKSHASMNVEDQTIWDNAYSEEFDGLSSLPTWELIPEAKYHQLYKHAKILPLMAFAKIKYDAHNRPKWAKYRIVVLGNHNYHQWSKESTTVPVMSQLELRVLTSLATHNRRILKNCDIKQAFVQSSIPENETYIVKPPVGCPWSTPRTYWKLLRSLYGLRRAPKLWYDKISSHLKAMGLHNSENSPCLFVGTLIEGQPPIYVGVYVNDIIYFSASDAVETQFEKLLSSIGEVDFMGQVTHFLGIEFTWFRSSDDHLSVTLTQQSFTESLLDSLQMSSFGLSHFSTPYRSGYPIDSIPFTEMSSSDRDHLRLKYQSFVGSLNWLAHTTRPDLSLVVSLLAKH